MMYVPFVWMNMKMETNSESFPVLMVRVITYCFEFTNIVIFIYLGSVLHGKKENSH